MKEQCLLIRTKDNRKFLTHQKNLTSLIEFSKTFGAEIYLVQPDKAEKVMELKHLTAAICNPDYKDKPKYTAIEKIHPKTKRDRHTILISASKIKTFIQKRLLSGKPISLKELKTKYKDYELTDACLCNHFSSVRHDLVRKGHRFIKLGAGKYCLETCSNS